MIEALKVSGGKFPVLFVTVGKPGREFYFFIPNYEAAGAALVDAYSCINFSKRWISYVFRSYNDVGNPNWDPYKQPALSIKIVNGDFEVYYSDIPNAFFHPSFFEDQDLQDNGFLSFLNQLIILPMLKYTMRDGGMAHKRADLDSLTITMIIEIEIKNL
jgi:hypothetical protein